jgi:regulator of RNase E activity RraA
MSLLSTEQLEELRQFDTPTVSNAIERFGVRPRSSGFMGPQIRCILKDVGVMVGYACTGQFAAREEATAEDRQRTFAWYDAVKETPRPVVAVLQDLDASPIGSFWGEIQATTHTALGCVGVVTNGGVRDLDEVADLGFGYWASAVLVSHANVHVVRVGGSVEVGGVTVAPGELVHADQHGVCLIPHEVASELAAACRAVQAAERLMLEPLRERIAQGREVDVEELKRWRAEMVEKRGG